MLRLALCSATLLHLFPSTDLLITHPYTDSARSDERMTKPGFQTLWVGESETVSCRDGIPIHNRSLYPSFPICTCTFSYFHAGANFDLLKRCTAFTRSSTPPPYAFTGAWGISTRRIAVTPPTTCPPIQNSEAAERWCSGGLGWRAISRMTVGAACDGRCCVRRAILLRVLYGVASTRQRAIPSICFHSSKTCGPIPSGSPA